LEAGQRKKAGPTPKSFSLLDRETGDVKKWSLLDTISDYEKENYSTAG